MSDERPDHEEQRRGTAWRLVLIATLGTAAAWLLRGLMPWFPALFLGAAWTAAALFLLIDTAVRRLWIVYLALTALVLILFGPAGEAPIVVVPMNFCFLLLRRHRPWRLLSSAQCAAAFFLVAAALVLVSWDWRWPDAEGLGWLTGLFRNLGRSCQVSMGFFLSVSLLRLLFGIRLHFLRLRPKLAVMAILIAAVPLLLLSVFGLVALYGAMGGVTAARGRDVLQDWAANPAAIRSSAGLADSTVFDWSEGRATGSIPAWLDDFRAVLHALPPDTVSAGDPGLSIVIAGEEQIQAPRPWAPADTTAVFRIDDAYWFLDLRGVGTGGERIAGTPLDERILDHLSALLHADVGLWGTGGDMDAVEGGAETDDPPTRASLQGAYRDSVSASFWQRPLYFGGAQLPTLELVGDHFESGDLLMHAKVRLADLADEFVAEENNLNQALLLTLIFIAGLLLLIQAAAGWLGLRITNGVISAVGELRKGTQRLAAGDLDARISVPNQDEFGDLADSFNEMAAAVRTGREEAVARERLEKELETARAIQERLLPHDMPTVPGFEITGASIPSLQVGGDYFDFLDQSDGRLGVAIGDISGKGIPAALLMSNLQASLHGQVLHPDRVSGVVGRVNDLLVRSTDPHMFATFFYGVLDRRDGSFVFTNAGHNPPLLRRRDGEIVRLEAGGLPLGMLDDVTFEQDEVTLESGDILLLYTDGITEAIGPLPDGSIPREEDTVETMFGEERLTAILAANGDRGAGAIRKIVLRAVTDHTAGVPQSDDITLVVLTRF